MVHYASLPLVLPVRCLWVALVIVGISSTAAGQPSATIVAIEGATTTYHSIDQHGKVVTVQVPSQSAADIRGVDARGHVQATVTAIDTTTNQVKVQTPAGQTIVLALSPAALKSIQIGDAFTFTVPVPRQ
jgi:Na+/H+ antiporter NhaB